MAKITRKELEHLLDTHLIVIEGKIWGKEQVINYLMKEIERQEIDIEEIKKGNKWIIFLN